MFRVQHAFGKIIKVLNEWESGKGLPNSRADDTGHPTNRPEEENEHKGADSRDNLIVRQRWKEQAKWYIRETE